MFIHTTVASAEEDALVEGKVVVNRRVSMQWKNCFSFFSAGILLPFFFF